MDILTCKIVHLQYNENVDFSYLEREENVDILNHQNWFRKIQNVRPKIEYFENCYFVKVDILKNGYLEKVGIWNT